MLYIIKYDNLVIYNCMYYISNILFIIIYRTIYNNVIHYNVIKLPSK